MNSQRIEMLKKLILEEPNDPFYKYGLALEYVHSNRAQSLSLLKELLQTHPDYLPTYYQAGLLGIESGDAEEGQTILKRGIELAQRQRELKTLNELRSLLDSL
jgi:tetratricopeptide (TPR) repeat protein